MLEECRSQLPRTNAPTTRRFRPASPVSTRSSAAACRGTASILCRATPASARRPLACNSSSRAFATARRPCTSRSPKPSSSWLAVARSHHWAVDSLHLYELTMLERNLSNDARQTMFHPSEVELQEMTTPLFEEIVRVKPTRLVIDSLSEIRLLAAQPAPLPPPDPRAQAVLRRPRSCTVLLLDDSDTRDDDLQLQSIAHGVVALEQLDADLRRRPPAAAGRQAARRQATAAGYHDYRIETRRHRRVSRASSRREHRREPTSVPAAERHPGARRAARRRHRSRHQHAARWAPPAPASRRSRRSTRSPPPNAGERVAIFAFDESLATCSSRVRAASAWTVASTSTPAGCASSRSIRPSCRPASSSHAIRRRSRSDDVRVVVIDSLNGYLHAMPERAASSLIQMHELLTYLGQHGVTTILVIGAARPGRPDDADPGRRQLPGRYRDAAALFRGRGRGAPGDLGGQEAQRQSRAHASASSRSASAASTSASRSRRSMACSPAFRPSTALRE